MDALMLNGLTPILLIAAVIAIVIFLISRKISKKTLFLTSTVLSLICIGILFYSIESVGGWDGFGLLMITVSSFIGLWIGTICGLLFKRNIQGSLFNEE